MVISKKFYVRKFRSRTFQQQPPEKGLAYEDAAMRCSTPKHAGFSLLELIITMGVIVLLVSLIVPAVGSFGRSTALVTAGNTVVNLANFARQQAITKGTLTALVLVCRHEGEMPVGEEMNYRTFAVLEYQEATGWNQITAWSKLPTGIMVDHPPEGSEGTAPGSSFFQYSPAKFPFVDGSRNSRIQEDPPVRLHGRVIEKYAARIFMPSGALKNPDEPAQIRLVEGFEQNGAIKYTKPDDNGGTANYYDIFLIGATGAVKVKRP